MATAATATRSRTTTPHTDATGVQGAVLNTLAGHEQVSLGELRKTLHVGDTGPSESQLTRTLRQLVASGQVTRPKRGFYAVSSDSSQHGTSPMEQPAATAATMAAGTGAVPAPRRAAVVESLPKKRAKSKPGNARAKAAKRGSTAPIEVSQAHVEVEAQAEATAQTQPVVEPASIARALTAAPSRRRKVNRNVAKATEPVDVVVAAVSTIEPVSANVEVETTSPAQSVDAPAHVDESPTHIAATQSTSTGLQGDLEVPVQIGTFVKVQVDDLNVSDVAEVVDVEGSEADEGAPAPTTLMRARPAPAPAVPISQIEAASDYERVWIRKALLPVAWFALTGLALMLAGAIIGGLVGIILAALAGWIYVQERDRQRELDRIRTSDDTDERQARDGLTSIGVS